ncbi:Glyoxalase-like domain-containing protein [Roseovarius azorensis]|uniref:Glyoxalase-like domain-containing protein n=1 Tax=Roseovarius azorensis TaxID=1287727 RepID=A0A1H7SYK4_9RHOB|nr:VOC family protein [Roseovarius azorensis]SEL77681.1 Glyoxalase-like domain-containing protein [Roseovarius azorensis]
MRLDHLAVAAETLEAGRTWVEDRLGLPLQPGGRHIHFGTHNLLLGLEEGLYLEVISTNPEAPAPGYPRWFDLDRFSGPPRLQTWICAVDDLDAAVAQYPRAGAPVALARGDLRWRMAVPEDGILPWDNRFPALIEWQGAAHPAARLEASGARLERLVVCHPEAAALRAVLDPVLRDARVVFEPGASSLRAEFATPGGMKVLE